MIFKLYLLNIKKVFFYFEMNIFYILYTTGSIQVDLKVG